MRVRRVVTGHDADGKAVVASDEDVDAVTVALSPDQELHRLWGADEVVTFPDDGSMPRHTTYFPPIGGFRFGLFSVPPATSRPADDVDLGAAFAEIQEKLPGIAAHMEPDNPGMHTTATVDFEYVIEGEVVLELDDGVEVTLRAGDTVVQNGTRHAWHNRTDTTARLVVVLVGADHDRVP